MTEEPAETSRTRPSETVVVDRRYIREQANVALRSFVAPLSGVYKAAEAQVAGQTQTIEEKIERLPPLSESQVAAIEQRIHGLQQRAGYTSDYDSWITKVTPPDLE